jgi:hypothetical protein
MTCNISRAIQQSETATFGYTGTKVTDIATNQLAEILNSVATNSSTQVAPPTYTLTWTKGVGVDSITSLPAGIDCGSTCAYAFDSGTVVSNSISCLTAYGMPAITGDCASDGSATMSADKACGVTCSAGKTLTITPPVNGEIVTSDDLNIDCGGGYTACSALYFAGATPSLTGTCKAGDYNDGTAWSGNGTGTTTRSFTMDSDQSVSFDCIKAGARISGGSMGGGSIQ